MKCPKCGNELILTPMSMCLERKDQKKDFCQTCFHKYSEKELQDIRDIKMLDEDLEIWKEAQKYK